MRSLPTCLASFLSAALITTMLSLVLLTAARRGTTAAALNKPSRTTAFFPTIARYFYNIPQPSCPFPVHGPPGTTSSFQSHRRQGRFQVLASVKVPQDVARGKSTLSTSSLSGVSPAAPAIVRVLDDGIKKPARDDRQYRMIWLKNGMQVLLTSDPTTDVASASMNIHAGHFQDPEAFAGLAHFHEHMLFLGTDRYPKEGEYEQFLNQNGGSSNAYTAMEDTNYYFSIKWEELQGALDRFSAFFTCPRFDNASTEREMKAVDSEHTNNLQDDGWRLFQLQKSTAHPEHPFHKFGSGNLRTLLPPQGNVPPCPSSSSLPPLPSPAQEEAGLTHTYQKGGMEATREALLAFHTTYYSADIMKLAIVGREDLDTLQNDRAALAFPIPGGSLGSEQVRGEEAGREGEEDGGRRFTVWEGAILKRQGRFISMFGKCDKPKLIRKARDPAGRGAGEGNAPALIGLAPAPQLGEATGTSARSQAALVPFLPSLPRQSSKPARYLAHLLGHEGKGSLHSYLNSQGWIESLSAGSSVKTADMDMFKVSLSLTQAGMEHIEEIVGLVYQYLKLLRSSPVDRKVFEELKTMSEIKFLFREKENAVDFASGISSMMHEYPPENILWGPYALDWDEQAVRDYLSLLTPERMHLTVVSKAFEEEAQKEAWAKEKWYGTLHKLEKLPEAKVAAWSNPPEIHPMLSLPSPNEFLPTDFSLICEQPAYKSLAPDDPVHPFPPSLLFPSSAQALPASLPASSPERGVKVFHKLDTTFKVPKVQFFAHLLSRQIYSSPPSVVLHRLYNMLLRDELNEFAYEAAMAGLSYSVTTRTTGLSVKVSGYSHKLPVLLEKVAGKAKGLLQEIKDKGANDPEIQQKFNKHRLTLLREYMNFDREAPYERALYNTRQVLDGQAWHLAQYIQVLNDHSTCNVQAMTDVVEEGMARLDCDAYAHGNVNAEEALSYFQTLKDSWGFSPLYDGEQPEERAVMLHANSTLIYQTPGPNPEEDNSATEVYIQCGPTHLSGGDTKSDVILDVLSHMASTSAYQRLRTEQQLGYIVFAFLRRLNGGQGLSVVVQSPSASPPQLDGFIEDWMADFREKELGTLSDEDFESHLLAVESMKLEKDKRLSEEAYRHWAQIVERRYDFYREKREVAVLRTLTKEDLLSFWDTHISVATAPARRKLAVYVHSSKHASDTCRPDVSETGKGVILVESMEALRKLKRGLSLFPAPGEVEWEGRG
ncbi:insulysin [Nannochloropsis gaditana CCMP526]|uniref:insulysin n=1 Tax=Nannochloropsis gaditana (strain CCMP526) TaxID=1093141 RepID=UPI00029F7890|nr:insulysin [Nannochloropsis gaditana CCMP526]EKU21330.1 insulysin [Nannochloropsis gaditana CCMP526]|eukprot:XP_005855032.1 insulysin [Nannochloropsis gaditana CCMP526]